MDYGLESCSLTLRIPPLPNANLEVANIGEDAGRIDVWALSTPSKIDVGTLSWKTKPERKTYLGSLTASVNGTDELAQFPCQQMSLQTFELACPSSGCAVDITSFGEEDIGEPRTICVLFPS